ncbi:MAG: 50S ribosomal protein L11 methyltransferase [Oscillibacter sp.]
MDLGCGSGILSIAALNLGGLHRGGGHRRHADVAL